MKYKSDQNLASIVLMIIYLVVLIWILLFKLGVKFSYMTDRKVNLTPFKELVTHGKIDYSEIIMNVIIFIPMGIYAAILFKKWNFGKTLLIFISVSLFIEVLQYTLKIGAFDMTDIITNAFGGVIGFLTYKNIERAFNNSNQPQNYINIIAAIGTIIMILFLFLLKTNRLGIRYQ